MPVSTSPTAIKARQTESEFIQSTEAATAPTSTPSPPAHYPEPVVRDPYNLLAGYYLDSQPDTAILYAPALSYEDPPFAAENIVLVTDGTCASTCSVFVDVMMNTAKVTNTLVWGGYPNDKPMQFVGGTRGSSRLDYDELGKVAQGALQYQTAAIAAGKVGLSEEKLQQLKDLAPIPPSEFPIQFGNGGVNRLNAYKQGSDIPLQWDHQPAGCRLFYTAKHIREPASMWPDVVDAVWGGKGCKAPTEYVTDAGGGTATSSAPAGATSSTAAKNEATARMGNATIGILMLVVALMAAALML